MRPFHDSAVNMPARGEVEVLAVTPESTSAMLVTQVAALDVMGCSFKTVRAVLLKEMTDAQIDGRQFFNL